MSAKRSMDMPPAGEIHAGLMWPMSERASRAISRHSSMVNDAHKEVFRHANASSEASWEWEVLHRPEFYEQVPNVSLVVRCLEDAPYACFMLQKGVI